MQNNYFELEYITQENDDISEVFFTVKGLASYVLPAFDNYAYITIEVGDMFGHVDIALHKRAIEVEILRKLQRE